MILLATLFKFYLLVNLCWSFPEGDLLSVEIQEPKVKDIEYVPEETVKNESNSLNENSSTPQGRIFYNGNQVWKVVVDDDSKRKVIGGFKKNKDIATWGGNVTSLDILVKPQSLKEVAKKLQENNMKYEVIIQDLQKAIDEENPPLTEDIQDLQDRTGHRLTWQAYHRLNDIYGFLDYLATSYPSLCTLYTIGSSVEGRPLKVLKISNGHRGNKAVWIDGGVHAREWISPATVTYLINYLVENFEKEDRTIQNIDWHILSVANPDGYEYSHTIDRLWRKNRKRGYCFGTDLNRNFGYKWGGKGSSKDPCQEIYGGNGPFSEPETAAIKDYITQTNAGAPWKAYLSFHSYGQYILYPWGYDRVVALDEKDLKNLGNKAASAIRTTTGAYYKVGSSSGLLYPAAGGSDDWAKGTVGMKYAYTIELRDSGYYGFVLPASYINPTAKEALAAVKVIAAAVSVA